jgi:hypothetical protein
MMQRLLCSRSRPDLKALRTVAVTLDDAGPAATITPIGAWGPWINGGAWLTVGSQPVDLLDRDLSGVRATINQHRAGEVGRYDQPGHPHGFISAIDMISSSQDVDGSLSSNPRRGLVDLV